MIKFYKSIGLVFLIALILNQIEITRRANGKAHELDSFGGIPLYTTAPIFKSTFPISYKSGYTCSCSPARTCSLNIRKLTNFENQY